MAWATAGVHSTCLAIAEEDKRSIAGRNEPEEHIDHVDPSGALHADDTAVALRILLDIHLAEDAKEDQVEKEDEGVQAEKEPRLDEREHEGERGDGA